MRPAIYSLVMVTACASSPVIDPPIPKPTAKVTIENISPWIGSQAGAPEHSFEGSVHAVGPGDGWEISFTAGRADRLSFATMLGESNDWFFAPSDRGMKLYDPSGAPITGDVTSELALYDLGTEWDQELGIGLDTGTNQRYADQGMHDDVDVVKVPAGAPYPLLGGLQFAVPPVAAMIRATLAFDGDGKFRLRIENVSTPTTLVTRTGTQAIHLSPPAWIIHPSYLPSPLFTTGTRTRRDGMRLLAEAGDNSELVDGMKRLAGESTALGKAVFAVHQSGAPLFSIGARDLGVGLEQLAEDGNPDVLAASLAIDPRVKTSGALSRPAFQDGAEGSLYPAMKYVLEVEAEPGDRLSLATMLGNSNDWFYATEADGVPLTNDDGSISAREIAMELLDAGTEADQPLRYGADTGPMQAAPGQGAVDPDTIVRGVARAHDLQLDRVVRVTIDDFSSPI